MKLTTQTVYIPDTNGDFAVCEDDDDDAPFVSKQEKYCLSKEELIINVLASIVILAILFFLAPYIIMVMQ